MTFVSYSQNFEDAVLFRALQHIENGFYIDVGANDPNVESITKAFYERGWHGINIEPVNHWFEKLVKERPSDVNLQVAAGDNLGKLAFFEILETGLSTGNVDFARRHEKAGFVVVERVVPLRTLNDICAQYLTGQEIHFLKIDVEGFEASVLNGLDLTLVRPWILVIEATEPLSTVETWQEWEPQLLHCNYSFAHFDKLNRFYFANEYPKLGESLRKSIAGFDCKRAN